jgi:hypothetical protein
LLTTHYKRLFPHTYESGRSGSDRPSQNRERRQHYITQPKPYSPLAPVGLPTLETKDLDNRRFVFASPIPSCTAEPGQRASGRGKCIQCRAFASANVRLLTSRLLLIIPTAAVAKPCQCWAPRQHRIWGALYRFNLLLKRRCTRICVLDGKAWTFLLSGLCYLLIVLLLQFFTPSFTSRPSFVTAHSVPPVNSASIPRFVLSSSKSQRR